MFVLVTTFWLALAQDNCGTIGSSNIQPLSVETDRRFYLNTANPAPCAGNITSWRICYYGPSSVNQISSISYTSTYAVYRRMGSGGDVRYQRVSDAFRAIATTSRLAAVDPRRATVDSIIHENGFTCYNDTNDINMPVSVQAGDLVGVCIFSPEDGSFFTRNQLNVVGDGGGESLLQMSNVGGCSVDSIPSGIQADNLSTVNNRRLHIYANIG